MPTNSTAHTADPTREDAGRIYYAGGCKGPNARAAGPAPRAFSSAEASSSHKGVGWHWEKAPQEIQEAERQVTSPALPTQTEADIWLAIWQQAKRDGIPAATRLERLPVLDTHPDARTHLNEFHASMRA